MKGKGRQFKLWYAERTGDEAVTVSSGAGRDVQVLGGLGRADFARLAERYGLAVAKVYGYAVEGAVGVVAVVEVYQAA